MLKLKVMGHMKFISQMIQDGSFDREFMPALSEAVKNNKEVFKLWGTLYTTGYGKAIANFAEGFKDNIDELKDFENKKLRGL